MLELGVPITLTAHGRSMYPTYTSPQKLIVQNKEYDLGDTVLAYSETLLYRVHRIVKKEPIGLRLKGDGSIVLDECLSHNNILGVVVGVYYHGMRLMYNRNTFFYFLSRHISRISLLRCKTPYVQIQTHVLKRILYAILNRILDIALYSMKHILILLCTRRADKGVGIAS